MPGPADERIRRFLEQRAEDRKAAEKANQLDKQHEKERSKKAERIKAKWSADTHIIAKILTDLKEKLAETGLQLKFQDTGSDGKAIAGGRIMGRFSGAAIDLTLKVYADGAIETYKSGPRLGPTNIDLVSQTPISVLTANKGEYEALILDALGVD